MLSNDSVTLSTSHCHPEEQVCLRREDLPWHKQNHSKPSILLSIFSCPSYHICMITAKFGGTAITPRNLVYVKKILTPNHKVVVVSAIGKCHPNDVKTTDILSTYYKTHDPTLWYTVCQRYRQLVDVNCIDVDVDELLFDAHNRALAHNLDYCISLGEELSAKIVARYLNATYVEAQDVFCFGNRSLRIEQTLSCLKNALKGANLAVIGGFYGGWANIRKTFSRGGSDVTASYCALATQSELCENWTDANGVCQGNPTEIFGVKTLTHLSYAQMYHLAKSGAMVLHPDAVKPLQKRGIPLVVGNFYNPNGQKTVVSNNPNGQKLLCVTQKQIDGKFVVTVLHNMPQRDVFARLQLLSDSLRCQQTFCGDFFANFPVESVFCNDNAVIITCSQNVLQRIFDAFNCDLQCI